MNLSDVNNVAINITDGVIELTDSLVGEFSVDPPDKEERPRKKRCSIGTPDESEADLCRQCAGCKSRRSVTPLGELPPLLERAAFVEQERFLPLDFTDNDRLTMFASLDDAVRGFAAKRDETDALESSKGISFNVLSPGPLFLLNNLFEM